MKYFYIFIGIFFILPYTNTFSAPENWNNKNITLKHEYQHFTLDIPSSSIINLVEKDIYKKTEDFCYDENIEKKLITQWEIDQNIIKNFLKEKIAPEINQELLSVRIYKNSSGNIEFEGFPQKEKTLLIDESALLIEHAIRNNINYVTLAVKEKNPEVIIDSPELKEKGITSLVSVGRSDFYPSSKKRIHNIEVGAKKFNGMIIPQNEVFDFNTLVGDINGVNGYEKEYVILGDKTVPEYGGGICQVSSTAYRAAMTGGFEIVERHFHSYAVSHYQPYGSDATIYQGVKNFRFKNDTSSDVLIQTRIGGKNNSELFFYYYGTPEKRLVKILGPVRANFKSPPPDKSETSPTLAPGQKQVVSNRVSGFDTTFSRLVKTEGQTKYNDRFFSAYQARPYWVIYGEEESVSSQEVSREDDVQN